MTLILALGWLVTEGRGERENREECRSSRRVFDR